MINSTFNEQLQIVETEFAGGITAEEVLDYIIAFKDNTSYPRKLKCIIDATHATFKFSFKDLKTFNEVKDKSVEKYYSVIFAIIINHPETAAISTLYESISNDAKHQFKVFSTHEAALIWIEAYGV